MGMLVCPLCCDNQFSSHLSLRNHLLGVVKNVHCPECKERFETILELAFHLDGMCPIAIDGVKSEEILKSNDQTESKKIVVGEENNENIFHENEMMQVDEDPHNAENCDSIATYIKIEKDDENNEFSQVTCSQNPLSDPLKFEIDGEERQISDIEFESVEQSENDTSSHHHSTDMEEMQCNSLTSVGNDLEASGIFVQKVGLPGSSHRFSCSKCGVTFKSIPEHIRKFHNGLNGNINMVKYKAWDKEAMRRAIIAVRAKEMGYKAASKVFKVPRATLRDYIKKGTNQTAEELVDQKSGRRPILPQNLEEELVQYCMEMENKFYGLTPKDLRRMAYQLAIRNNVRHPFSNDQKAAGRKWMHLFFTRHPQLSLRKPQSLSLARIQGFSKENVDLFFTILKPELDKVKHNPLKVFNVDETSISVVQHKSQKIVAKKGKREVHKLSSAERGSLVTVVMCMSAAGQYVPPMMIFPGKLMKAELLDGAPPGTIGAVHESGWITGDLFEKWFQHFVNIVKPSKEDPVVLVLDGHYSHIRNINVVDCARENGVSVVCLPPNSTAKMQPLDVAFMFSFKTFCTQAIENWLNSNPGQIVTNLQLARLLREGYEHAATMEIAVKGFCKTGILPYKPNTFSELDFIAHAQIEPPVEEETETTLDNSLPVTVSPQQIKSVCIIQQPSTSKSRGSAILVTSSPHKNKLQDGMAKKSAPSRKRKNKTASCSSSKAQKSNSAIKTFCVSDSESSVEVNYASTDNEDSDDDVQCPLCGKNFSSDKHGAQWIRCTKCYIWFHETCCSSSNKDKFICDICLEG